MQINKSDESGGTQPYQQNRIYNPEGISPALTTDTRPPNIIVDNPELNQLGFINDANSQANRVYDANGKFVCLQGEAGGGGAKTGLYLLQIPEATKAGFVEIAPGECFDAQNINSETRRGRLMDEKSNTLMAKTTDFLHYTENYKIRRLTPVECERLQTVPDGYTACVSDSQRYRMLGNGWTVAVISYILSFYKN
jgi:DNA (cytosine-5)-methyltransferase 3A